MGSWIATPVGQIITPLITLVLGAVLTLIVTRQANIEARQNALAVARDQRLFELRRQAVKDVRDAMNTAEKLQTLDRSQFNLQEFIGVRQGTIEPIIAACDAFGLDVRNGMIGSLSQSLRKMLEAQGSESEFRKAVSDFMLYVFSYENEIREAWKRTLEGR